MSAFLHLFFFSLGVFPAVCLQSDAGVSFTVTTCEIVFHQDGCFLLYSWHPGKHSHLQNCLIWMLWRRTRIHTNTAHGRTWMHSGSTHTHVCPKDNAWLVFCSYWWWRVVVTVLLSTGLMHYNTALPCCLNGHFSSSLVPIIVLV